MYCLEINETAFLCFEFKSRNKNINCLNIILHSIDFKMMLGGGVYRFMMHCIYVLYIRTRSTSKM